MAGKNTAETAAKTESNTEQVTLPKEQFAKMLEEFAEMKAKVASIESAAESASKMQSAEARRLAEEKKLIELTKAANEAAEELEEIYIDKGSLKSNKNLELSINEKQYVIPKGKKQKLPKSVVEVIRNSERQSEFAMGVQQTYADEAEKAIAEGKI